MTIHVCQFPHFKELFPMVYCTAIQIVSYRKLEQENNHFCQKKIIFLKLWPCVGRGSHYCTLKTVQDFLSTHR